MRHIILYRDIDFRDELAVAQKHFLCTSIRPQIQKDDLVIGRYSVLPYYYEQAKDIEYVGAQLINSHSQHVYIADLMNYVEDLKEMTPRTWYSLQDLPDNGPFVLKGSTNSKKHNWNELMFAKDKKAAIQVHGRLSEDGLIGYQQIYIREYVPLVTYATSIGGLPITKEFRFFVAFGEVLCGEYYWSNFRGEFEKPSVDEVPKEFLEKAISRIGTKANFYALDVAQTLAGNWIVVEVNDGQCSGPSDNDLDLLYSNLKKVCEKHYPESK